MCALCRGAGLFAPSQPRAFQASAADSAAGLPAGVRHAFTGVDRIDAVLSGTKWNTTALTYALPTSVSTFDLSFTLPDGPVFNPLRSKPDAFLEANEFFRAAVPQILNQFAAVSNLTFASTSDPNDPNATLKIAMLDSDVLQTSDQAFFPWRNIYRAEGIFFPDQLDERPRAPQRGNYDWVTTIHEIGHALGLKHPFQVQTGGQFQPPNFVRSSPERNSTEYSVMSYAVSRGTIGPDGNASAVPAEKWGEAQTLMQDDIQALQALYGPNYHHNAGDTTYTFSPTTGEIFVNGVGQGRPGGDGTDPRSNTIFATIWDGGGIDTYDFSNFERPADVADPQSIELFYYTLDLRPGAWSTFSRSQLALIGYRSVAESGPAIEAIRPGGNIANALLFEGDPRALIENVLGTRANDVIVGNQAANVLAGNGGDDAIFGLDGNDWLSGGEGRNLLDGGAGFDTALYRSIGRRGISVEAEPRFEGDFATTIAVSDIRADRLFAVEAAEFVDGRLLFEASGPFAAALRLYVVALGREGDPRGLDAAGTRLAAGGATPAEVAGDLIASTEFAARFGTALTNTQFVTVLYQNLRGTEGDAEGVAAWTSALDAGTLTRAQVTAGFAASAEAVARTAETVAEGLWDADDSAILVARAYQGVLNRAPDISGLQGWKDAVKAGAVGAADLFRAFLNSPEGQALHGATDNAGFVQRLFQSALDRAADPGGLEAYVTALASGALDRGQAALSVATSAEFDRVQGAAIFGSTQDPGILFL